MNITLLQLDVHQDDVQANIAAAERLMAAAPASRLYVLPEMWATGFDPSPTASQLRAASTALSWMVHTAGERQCYVAGTLPARQAGHLFNRFYVVAPDARLVYYDKRHLFRPGGEGAHYTAGRQRVVVDVDGLRLLLATCYDLRFPVFLRQQADYDGILLAAAWPASRQAVWDVLVRARALENQCFVGAVNHVGADAGGSYAGGTMWVDAYGRVPQGLPLGQAEGAATFEPDMERQHHFREKFPVLADADAFELKPLGPTAVSEPANRARRATVGKRQKQ